jgi:hypothetical protein
MKTILAGCIVLLAATSGTTVDSRSFYLGMGGNDFGCVGVVVTIGGSSYTVKTGASSQLFGPTQSSFSSSSPVSATAVWFAGSSGVGSTCAGSTHDLCAAKQFTLSSTSGTICTQAMSDHESRTVGYQVTQTTVGGHTYWKIDLYSNQSGGML